MKPAPLNEGRSLNPGDTARGWQAPRNTKAAQRRPESEPRRHAPRQARMDEGDGALNEGRSLNPGDTGRPGVRTRRRLAPLNEGRSLNPGDTVAVAGGGVQDRIRSTKAGV